MRVSALVAAAEHDRERERRKPDAQHIGKIVE